MFSLMNVFKKVYFVIIAISVILLLHSCIRKAKEGPYLIGFSQYSSVEPIREAVNASIFDEAKKYSYLLQIEFADAKQDPAKQRFDIENFLRE